MSKALAERFHEVYEELAPEFSYSTRAESQVPWDELPKPHQDLMIQTVDAVVGDLLRECLDVLGFYADPETYLAIGFFPDPPCGDFMDDFEPVYDEYRCEDVERPGKRARALKAKIEKAIVGAG